MKAAMIAFFGLALISLAKIPVAQAQFLPGIALDSWNQILAQTSGQGDFFAPSGESNFMFAALSDTRPADAIFADLKARLAATKLIGKDDAETAQNYANLAINLEKLRQQYRFSQMKVNDRRKVLFMLQMMAEDVMYVGYQKYPSVFPKVISLGENVPEAPTKRKAQFLGFQVQTGDIVLSKAIGYGSSELIAFIMREPHIFSHSTMVDVLKGTNEIVSPEALIEDGLKLRRMRSEYEVNPPVKSRIFIYRLVDLSSDAPKNLWRLIEKATDHFVDWMGQKVSDPYTQAAGGYDLTMNVNNKDGNFFCTAVSKDIIRYMTARLTNRRPGLIPSTYDPYPETLWSSIGQRSQRLLAALDIGAQKIPAPGDLEANKSYELVGSVINVPNLAQERIEAAIMNVTLDYLGGSRATELLRFLAQLRDVKWTPDDMAKLEQLHVIPQDKLAKLKVMVQQIPKGMSLKQVAFFYFLDNVFMPEVRAMVMADTKDKIVGLDTLYSVAAADVQKLWRMKADALMQILKSKDIDTSDINSCTGPLKP